MSEFFKQEEVRKTIEILKPNGQLFEVRVLDGRKNIQSGYFTDAGTMIEALKKISLRESNVYLTLGYVNKACYSRVQRDTFRSKPGTTSDTDIDGYQWMLVDLDPVRSADVSSSDEELDHAKKLASDIYGYLKSIGFEQPVKAISGNGCHLLYKINLRRTEQNIELVHNCLKALDEQFSNEFVHVDTTNYNPSRICKLHGTLAQKGANTPERPHRMSRIFSDKEPSITDRVYLQKLANMATKTEPRQYRESPHGIKFDIVDFMHRNCIGYKEKGTGRDSSIIYALDECPFDSNHRNGDAKIFSYPDGRISFRCHHNSCFGRSWQDVRMHYEPNAYDHDRTQNDAQIQEGWRKQNRFNEAHRIEEQTDDGELFRTASQIMLDSEPDHEFIRSGITEIDDNMHGLEKQCISVISGLRGSGKTTMIGTLILSAIQDDHTVVVYSGELSNKKYLGWIDRQAAGKGNVQVSVKYKNGVGVNDATKQMIHDWFGEKFWLYDNRKGNQFKKIAAALEQILTAKKADLCIIDNMMALDLAPKTDKYDAQTEFVWALKNIAQRTNTHIVFVAHPKKVTGFIRLDDISGAGNIGNIVDNAFMVHRNNEDFKNKLCEFSKDLYKSIDTEATNFIEIAKDREGGLQDYFIPLYYEDTSKRLRNRVDENVVYGWVPDQYMAVIDDDCPF